MMNFKNEEAVSPVIGVILMVAITVILAAVIAAFVFGMTGNVQTTKSVAATVTQQGADTIAITYQGGVDHISVSYLNVTAPNGTIYATVSADGKLDDDPETVAEMVRPNVGAALVLHAPDLTSWTGRDHVIVMAHFTDGADQVILDAYV